MLNRDSTWTDLLPCSDHTISKNTVASGDICLGVMVYNDDRFLAISLLCYEDSK